MRLTKIRVRSRLVLPWAPGLALVLSVSTLFVAPGQQKVSDMDRERGRAMLRTIKSDLKDNYYDPAFHGMDLDERFEAADQKIKSAASLAQVFGIIGQVLLDLDDSHTIFLPPVRFSQIEYGWQMQMIGDKCVVTAVKPGSDAAAKGLKEGDEIYSLDGLGPTRENIWKLHYFYHAIRPVPGMRLVVIKPDGKEQELDVRAKVQTGKKVIDLTGESGMGRDIHDMIRDSENEDRLHRHRYVETEELFIWKMPAFDLEPSKVDEMMDKVRKRSALVLDLRGNGGGYEETLLRLVGNFFDHDVKIGELKRRKETKPLLAKARGSVFSGKLVVLVDSKSGSAAELFARTVQLEKRGTVIGDRSAGAVMRSRGYSHKIGADTVVFFDVSITDADIIMTDGKSLERTGVVPDELKLPAAEDMAARRDAVLAYAISLLGGKANPAEAGALFPIEWKK